MDEISFPIQMYDPKREYKLNKINIDNAIQKVLDHGLFINGPEVKELETTFSKYVGVKHCIGVSNGTDALKISLLALDVGFGDEVITVAHTWISTAEVISIIGAKPVFIDIDKDIFNMDPLKIEEKINDKTKAIIVVNLYGQMADYDKINKIANKYNIPVIEDGAQSFGAEQNGKKSCSATTIGTTSFFPAKPLGGYGDSGACFTNDDKLAIKIRAIKNHGGIQRFHHKYIGINARLDTIQAAILNVKFKYYDETLKNRIKCAKYYTDKLKPLEDKKLLILPKVNSGNISSWAQYSIIVNNKIIRDQIVDYLKKNKVNVAIFYPSPLHTQECFRYLGYKFCDLPVTEKTCNTLFNLPCYGEVTQKEQDYIISIVNSYFCPV